MQPNRVRITKVTPQITGQPKHFPPQQDYNDEISLLELVQALNIYKFVILGTVMASLLVATFYVFTARDIYRAETTLTPTSSSENKSNDLLRQLGGVTNITGIGQEAFSNDNAMALAILHSRTFTDSFIKDKDIADILTTNNDDTLSKPLTETEKQWQAYNRFDQSVRKTSTNPKNGIITLSIEWEDPLVAADWANSLVKKLNKHMQNTAIQEAEKSITYLNEQLKKTSVIELQSVINRLIESQVKKITLANVNEQYTFKVIDPAIPPQEKIRPQRKLIIILSIIAGIMFGIFLAFLLNFINKARNTA